MSCEPIFYPLKTYLHASKSRESYALWIRIIKILEPIPDMRLIRIRNQCWWIRIWIRNTAKPFCFCKYFFTNPKRKVHLLVSSWWLLGFQDNDFDAEPSTGWNSGVIVPSVIFTKKLSTFSSFSLSPLKCYRYFYKIRYTGIVLAIAK